jgi:hypothetical protein
VVVKYSEKELKALMSLDCTVMSHVYQSRLILGAKTHNREVVTKGNKNGLIEKGEGKVSK